MSQKFYDPQLTIGLEQVNKVFFGFEIDENATGDEVKIATANQELNRCQFSVHAKYFFSF